MSIKANIVYNEPMISNYHTHTYLCKHASGKPVDYVKQAAHDDCRSLGFSDHCPFPDDSAWPFNRMSVSEIPLYLAMIEEAKTIANFPVHWGFECEWYYGHENWFKDYLLGELGAEFLVYGSHWLKVESGFEYIPYVAEKKNLRPYVRLTVDALNTGLFDFFAHPDVFLAGYTRMTSEVKAACIDIIDAAVDLGIPMEINGQGLQLPKINSDSGMRRPYPVAEFWEMAAARGAIIVCNSDAHQPGIVIRNCKAAIDFARAIGIEPVDTVEAIGLVSRHGV